MSEGLVHWFISGKSNPLKQSETLAALTTSATSFIIPGVVGNMPLVSLTGTFVRTGTAGTVNVKASGDGVSYDNVTSGGSAITWTDCAAGSRAKQIIGGGYGPWHSFQFVLTGGDGTTSYAYAIGAVYA